MTITETITERINFLQETLARFDEADTGDSLTRDSQCSIKGGINQLEALRDEIASVDNAPHEIFIMSLHGVRKLSL